MIHTANANKGSPPQAAGYFRREPVGESRVASGTPGLTSWRGRGSWPGLAPQAAGNAPKGIQIFLLYQNQGLYMHTRHCQLTNIPSNLFQNPQFEIRQTYGD